jgi:hypothetical protein
VRSTNSVVRETVLQHRTVSVADRPAIRTAHFMYVLIGAPRSTVG